MPTYTYGGQALIEGVLMRGRDAVAVALRHPDGDGGEHIVKPDIHPTYYEAKVHCGSCGTEWTVGSTRPELRVDVCGNCHPFFTGKQTIIDTAGQVERFQKRLERQVRS